MGTTVSVSKWPSYSELYSSSINIDNKANIHVHVKIMNFHHQFIFVVCLFICNIQTLKTNKCSEVTAAVFLQLTVEIVNLFTLIFDSCLSIMGENISNRQTYLGITTLAHDFCWIQSLQGGNSLSGLVSGCSNIFRTGALWWTLCRIVESPPKVEHKFWVMTQSAKM